LVFYSSVITTMHGPTNIKCVGLGHSASIIKRTAIFTVVHRMDYTVLDPKNSKVICHSLCFLYVPKHVSRTWMTNYLLLFVQLVGSNTVLPVIFRHCYNSCGHRTYW